jgi:hypothetical protein
MAGGDETERRCVVGVQLGISSLSLSIVRLRHGMTPSPLSTPSRFTRDSNSRPFLSYSISLSLL